MSVSHFCIRSTIAHDKTCTSHYHKLVLFQDLKTSTASSWGCKDGREEQEERETRHARISASTRRKYTGTTVRTKTYVYTTSQYQYSHEMRLLKFYTCIQYINNYCSQLCQKLSSSSDSFSLYLSAAEKWLHDKKDLLYGSITYRAKVIKNQVYTTQYYTCSYAS